MGDGKGCVRVSSAKNSIYSSIGVYSIIREFKWNKREVKFCSNWFFYGVPEYIAENTHRKSIEYIIKKFCNHRVMVDGDFLMKGDYFIYQIPLSIFPLGDNRKDTLSELESALLLRIPMILKRTERYKKTVLISRAMYFLFPSAIFTELENKYGSFLLMKISIGLKKRSLEKESEYDSFYSGIL